MSLFGAMNTAVSGLSAQSNAFGNISDNVANSQTVGYKRVDTSFIDYLTTSTAENNVPGSVVTRPDYVNNVEGTITQTDNPLGLAITGQGFFAVSTQAGTANNLPTFATQQEYTRAGDFQMDKNGYLVNSAGEFLNGWPVTNGVVNQNTLTPIQVSQSVFNPIATKNVTLSANLPATPTALPITSDIDVYDSLGTMHTVTLSWQLNPVAVGPPAVPTNNWTVNVSIPDEAAFTGSANVTFGTGAAGGLPAGTVSAVDTPTNGVTVGAAYNPASAAAQPATMTLNADFGSGAQPIVVNLGTYGGTSGLTQYAGTNYNLRGLTQDGVPPGAFSSVSTATNGDISVNYDNGQSRVIAQAPLVTFNDPNGLQRQNGQAFTASQDSGGPLAETANTNGAGGLVTQSVEGSNVDIATEFSKLIVAQEAYSANTKLVTSADQMLQQTVNMKQ
ncbi:MAG: flagellar hook protein FlgE [Acetobacteraceae bacterium]|jgi:flagellar hook protein FlgE